jgi:invasion protein IalB
MNVFSHALAPVTVLGCLVLSGGASAAEQTGRPTGYIVKPSDVVLPKDVPLGAYVRTTQPFENWVLICDENLIRKQKVCNITQTIIDQTGAAAFSWSLAATQAGQPMMILRVPASVGADKPVTLKFSGSVAPLVMKTTGCNAAVCVTMLQVNPAVRDQIERAATIQVSYATGAQGTVRIDAPFKGLAAALAAIN